MLGVPVGHKAFVQKVFGRHRAVTCAVFQSVPVFQNAQNAWLLLLKCAGPRAHHIFRNLQRLRGLNSVKTTITGCGSAFHIILCEGPRWCGFKGGAVAFPRRGTGSSERCEIGTSGLLVIVGKLPVSGVRTSNTCVCSAFKKTGGTSFESTMRARSPGRSHVVGQ